MSIFSKKIGLIILAGILFLGMLRLGVWQLDRAEQKQHRVDQFQRKQALDALEITSGSDLSESNRYRKVSASGRYLSQQSIFVDNQVVDQQVGYQVFTPFKLTDSEQSILVARGWLAKIPNELPSVDTLDINDAADDGAGSQQTVYGRLNLPPARPPLWDDDYPTFIGHIWQYLPIEQLALEKNLRVFPLVLELAPDDASASLKRRWHEPDQTWVHRHKAYALQWFTMAAVFLVACLLVAKRARHSDSNDS